MANLYITYFKKLAEDDQGNKVPVGELPNGGGERVAFTTATNSSVIPKSARFVRLLADADAYIDVDDSPAPVATSALKIEANVAEYFGLDPQKVRAGTLKIGVYDGAS